MPTIKVKKNTKINKQNGYASKTFAYIDVLKMEEN